MRIILENQIEQLRDCLKGEEVRIVSLDDNNKPLMEGTIQVEEIKVDSTQPVLTELINAQSELIKQIEEKYPDFLFISWHLVHPVFLDNLSESSYYMAAKVLAISF